MIEEMTCQNKHKMIICWETGFITDRPCINKATKYKVDKYGIYYLCDECYKDDYKRKISTNLTMKERDD